LIVIVQAFSIAWPLGVGKFRGAQTNATIARELKAAPAI